MCSYSIGQVAEMFGLPISTLRYYDKEGLFPELARNAGKVFSIDEIYEKIWNEEAIDADNTVAVHIRHIREKIEINPREPRYLKVVWGVGYKVEKQ